MTKKKSLDEEEDDVGGAVHYYVEAPSPEPPFEPLPVQPQEHETGKSLVPALSIGDILALLTLIVLSAALLLEGFEKEFKDYSKEIVALFAVVVGFLLGRKT